MSFASIQPFNAQDVVQAAFFLRSQQLIGLPTETVYGLAANALDDTSVARIFAAKDRPSFNPLIVHVEDAAMAARYTVWNARAELLAQHFWPGPLTLVLPRPLDSPISLLVSAGTDRLAVRVPAHPVARAVIKAAGLPLAAPSANRSGRISPTAAAHVAEELGEKVAFILDGGPCEVGLESTVLDISGETPLLLRPGSITQAMLEAVLQCAVVPPNGPLAVLHAPGGLASHYAPRLPVRLNVTAPAPNEAWLTFGPTLPWPEDACRQLSKTGDLTEAAAHLFAYLRALDQPHFHAINVMPIPDTGIGMAINDRLRRAVTR